MQENPRMVQICSLRLTSQKIPTMSELEEKQESTHTVVIALCECVVVCVGAYNVWNLCVCVCVHLGGIQSHLPDSNSIVCWLLHAVSVLALAVAVCKVLRLHCSGVTEPSVCFKIRTRS